MPLRICGVSARITDFRKNSLVYDFANPNNNSPEMIDAYDEFAEKMRIRVARGQTILFEGSLKDLLKSVQSLSAHNLLNVGASIEYDFAAEMLTSAGNAVQGTSVTIDLIMHATQNNDDAVEQLLGTD
jgi:hypothetical protein